MIQPDRVLRFLHESGATELDAFLISDTKRSFADRIVETRPAGELSVEHPKIWFPSYPYEWPAEMLHAAGELTLDLAECGLQEGWGLKDATPYNVLFEGPRPLFVDVCSFERRAANDPVWRAYGQFVRTFLNPLLASRHLHLPVQALLLTSRDGIESEQLYRWTPWLRRWFSPLLASVTLPALLTRGPSKPRAAASGVGTSDEAQFVLKHLLGGLRNRLNAARPSSKVNSRWITYMQTFTYTERQFQFKSEFVEQALGTMHPKRTLDVGCNTGYFSRLAALTGSRVVAIDSDPAVVGRLWREASRDGLDIQPLIADFARPTPAVGWRNSECSSFLERAEDAFDLVLLLGTLHHLTVTDRIPVPEVLDQCSQMASHAVIEFVGHQDEMFRFLARGNEHLYGGYTVDAFESECRKVFEILHAAEVPDSQRRLYLLRRL